MVCVKDGEKPWETHTGDHDFNSPMTKGDLFPSEEEKRPLTFRDAGVVKRPSKPF